MGDKLIMALDQGTTSSRCILYDKNSRIVSVGQVEFRQQYPKPGWVEHDPMDIWNSQYEALIDALNRAHITIMDIAAIGITNQRETTICWNAKTGEPVCNAIVWQCRRTAAICDEMKKQGLEPLIHQKTGLLLDPYFSGTKLKWILENVPEAKKLAENDLLRFGTVDSWLIYKLSGGKVHATEASNASRTMLCNIHDLCWDKELLELLGIPASVLPQVKPSSGLFAVSDKEILGCEVPITGVAGDQQAALFGQLCLQKGQGKMTFGTGGFMLMNTGDTPVDSQNGLLTTIAWGLEDSACYALEGSMFMSGAVVQWLRDELKIIDHAAETEAMAFSLEDNEGVYLVPAFVGIGAPYWDSYARGSILGLSRGTNGNHIARAALECQVYQTLNVLEAMNEDMKGRASSLRVDGGACANNFMMKFLADITELSILRPAIIETTSMGAASLAGLACGYWKNTEEIASLREEATIFSPSMDDKKRQENIQHWHKAVAATMDFTKRK